MSETYTKPDSTDVSIATPPAQITDHAYELERLLQDATATVAAAPETPVRTADPETPARIPLAQAAKRLGVSMPTVHKWVKEGLISVTIDENRQKTVGVAELARVFPENVTSLQKQDAEKPPGNTHQSDVPLVQAALQATRDALSIVEAQLADAKERENRLLAIVESQTQLLEHKPEPAATVARNTAELTLTVWVTIIGVVGVICVLAIALWLQR